jgi:hypothetical protein
MSLFVRGKEVPQHLPLSNGGRAGQVPCTQPNPGYCFTRLSLIRYSAVALSLSRFHLAQAGLSVLFVSLSMTSVHIVELIVHSK